MTISPSRRFSESPQRDRNRRCVVDFPTLRRPNERVEVNEYLSMVTRATESPTVCLLAHQATPATTRSRRRAPSAHASHAIGVVARSGLLILPSGANGQRFAVRGVTIDQVFVGLTRNGLARLVVAVVGRSRRRIVVGIVVGIVRGVWRSVIVGLRGGVVRARRGIVIRVGCRIVVLGRRVRRVVGVRGIVAGSRGISRSTWTFRSSSDVDVSSSVPPSVSVVRSSREELGCDEVWLVPLENWPDCCVRTAAGTV